MDIRCRGLIAFLLPRPSWWLGPKLSTFGISISFLRCLCSCGAFSATNSQPRIIWCGGGFFLMKTWFVCLDVGVKKQQRIYFWDVTSSDPSGLRFGSGWVFLRFHLVIFINISPNLLKCLVCIDLCICFSGLFGLPLFRFFGRK